MIVQKNKKAKVRLNKNSKELSGINLHHFLKREFYNLKIMLIEIQSLQNDEDTDLIIKKALTERVIIKTVSIFEYFFKSVAHNIGSDVGVELNKVLKDGYEENRGKALSDSFTQSYPPNVINLYKKLLNRDIAKDADDYFSTFNNQGVEHEVYHIRNTPLMRRNWVNFYKLFDCRNKIIHENFTPNIKYSELRKMVGAVFDLMLVSQSFSH